MKTKHIITILLIISITSCSFDDGYRVDGDKVVYEHPWNEGHGTVIAELDADPLSFVILDQMRWAKDRYTVFMAYIPLEFMDPASFEVLSVNFAKDKYQVICGRDIIEETNPKDFKVKYHKYSIFETEIYGMDKKAVYLCSKQPNGYIRIPSQSIDFFEPLGDNFFKDNEQVTWGSRVLIDANPSTFEVLTDKYAKDDKNVFYVNRLVEGADPKSFKVTGYMHAKDKKHRYEMEDRVE